MFKALLSFIIFFDKFIDTFGQDYVDLLKSMMAFNPMKRKSAIELL